MASGLSAPPWMRPQRRVDGGLIHSEAGDGGKEADSAAGTARRLGEQALVFLLVLAPPLHVATANPEAFFGMLNVRPLIG